MRILNYFYEKYFRRKRSISPLQDFESEREERFIFIERELV
jgi:hypothetical protein